MRKLLLLALLPLSATAADELAMCTDYAELAIMGGTVPCGFMMLCDASDLKEKAAKKGFDCDPLDPYLELAKLRIQAKASRPQREPYPMPPPVRTIPPPTPRQTTCRAVGNTVHCTEY